MNPTEIREIIFRAARIRFPVLGQTVRLNEKIDALEDYIAKTAIVRGDLEEARLWAHEALSSLRNTYEDIEPDEEVLRGRRGRDAVKEAKAATDPATIGAMEDSQYLIDRCTDQIDRLELDYQAASRTYTLLSGG